MANQRREKITPAMVKEDTKNVELSNNRIMRLGEERLELREKMKKIERQEFWKKEIEIPEGIQE